MDGLELIVYVALFASILKSITVIIAAVMIMIRERTHD